MLGAGCSPHLTDVFARKYPFPAVANLRSLVVFTQPQGDDTHAPLGRQLRISLSIPSDVREIFVYFVTATINAIPCVTAFCIEMRTLPPRSSISPRNRIRHHPSRNCAHPNSPKFPEIREIPPPPGISPGGVKFPPPGGGGGRNSGFSGSGMPKIKRKSAKFPFDRGFGAKIPKNRFF